MTRILIFILYIFIFTSCAKNEKIGIYYSVTEFEQNNDNADESINGLQAVDSRIFKLELGENSSKTPQEIAVSEQKIVWHDFCQKSTGELFVVGGEFKHTEKTAQILKILPEKEELNTSDEVRIRDCVNIKSGNKEYIASVSHGIGELTLYDNIQKDYVSQIPVSYTGKLDEKIYTDITMNHEIIAADLDSDGIDELYSTPSSKNAPIGKGQNGQISRITIKDEELVLEELFSLGEGIHAKEIHPIVFGGKKGILAAATVVSKIEYPKTSISPKQRFMQNIKAQDRAYTQLIFLYLLEGKFQSLDIGKNDSFQCRVISQGSLGYSNEDIAMGCNEGGVSIYTPEEGRYTLKKNIPFDNVVLSLDLADVDKDGIDEIIAGVNKEGIYIIRGGSETKRIVDLSGKNNWVWSIELINN